jgi:hypothetical protein
MHQSILLIIILVTWFSSKAQNNVGIGTYTPHSSSILELKASDKGILIPRLSTTERLAIANPENSLLVFDTNFDCFYYFTSNNGWISLCPGNPGSGNSSVLLNTSTEPAGINCAFGGFKIEFGFDSNSNLVLENSEVNPSLTKYVCNGGPGAQGPAGINGTNGQNSLVKTTPESAGANCATGGVILEYGLDANGNGVLDVSEIDATLTQYVCNGSAGPQGPIGATGLTGAQGTAGANGSNGTNGLNGTNGQNSLVKTTPESAGANCATGGVKLEYGLDANGNGVLDISEIDATLTQYVCNGSAGPQGPTGASGAQGPQGIQGPAGPTGSQGPIGLTGPAGASGPQGAQGPAGINGSNGTNSQNSLVKTTSESAGANCATGGVKLEYGLDANSNGVLDVSEIDATLTQYVCNGSAGPQGPIGTTGLTGPQGPAGINGINGSNGLNGTNGQNSLVKTTPESAGANCATGGVKLEYGLDANSNGVLDVSEIDATLTQYVCNGSAGSQGPTGATGAQGPQGIQGPAGPTGATGATGPSLFSNMQVYATPGTFTFTIPAGVTKIMVEVWGGGGGGGNSSATVTGFLSGGGGGGYGRSIFSVSSGTNYSVVVGAGGTAGGGNGGNSSFGTSINATGGIGGCSITAYKIPDGGTSNGSFNVSGGSGFWDSSNTGSGPHGGGSFGSHGGRGAQNGLLATVGNAPGGGGAGGAGGYLTMPAQYVAGSAGGAGRVVVWY